MDATRAIGTGNRASGAKIDAELATGSYVWIESARRFRLTTAVRSYGNLRPDRSEAGLAHRLAHRRFART